VGGRGGEKNSGVKKKESNTPVGRKRVREKNRNGRVRSRHLNQTKKKRLNGYGKKEGEFSKVQKCEGRARDRAGGNPTKKGVGGRRGRKKRR